MDNLQVFDKDVRKIGADRGGFTGVAAQIAGDTAVIGREGQEPGAGCNDGAMNGAGRGADNAGLGADNAGLGADNAGLGADNAGRGADNTAVSAMLRKAARQAAREILKGPTGAAEWEQAREEEPENADADEVEERNRRIRKEKNRLKKLFRGIDEKSRAVVDGLIEQAAFLRVQLQDLAADIVVNGTTELFAQGKDQEPYDRQRPAANVYNSMNGNYQKIIKQLNELLPKAATKTPVEDGFRDFINGRDDY